MQSFERTIAITLGEVSGTMLARYRSMAAIDFRRRVSDLVGQYLNGGDWDRFEAEIMKLTKGTFNEWTRDTD